MSDVRAVLGEPIIKMGNKMTLEIDFDALSIDQMNELEANLKKFRESRKRQHLIDAKKEFQTIANSYGFTIEEIVAQKIGKVAAAKTVEAKYRDPEVGSRTWTGRGKKPLWVQAAQDSGISLDEMRIHNENNGSEHHASH